MKFIDRFQDTQNVQTSILIEMWEVLDHYELRLYQKDQKVIIPCLSEINARKIFEKISYQFK